MKLLRLTFDCTKFGEVLLLDLTTTSTKITLDWDNINLHEAFSRFRKILDSPNTKKAKLLRSATKGFHCRVEFFFPVRIAKCRFELNDDPRRLLHDLFNRDNRIHDILWSRKSIAGIIYKAETVMEVET